MNELYMQFANCIPVKGYSRSVLYDVQNTRYLLIDNDFAELLIKKNNKIPLTEIGDFKDLIESLVEGEWGIYTTKQIASNFPDLDLQWKHYAEITNVQIDFIDLPKSSYNFFQNILSQIEQLNCKTLQVNIFNSTCYSDLQEFLMKFSDTLIHQLIIHLPYILINSEQSDHLFEQQPRLHQLCYYNCPKNIEYLNKKSYYSVKSINDRKVNEILTDYFTTNIRLFTESQFYNTYYNKKLCIDASGNIKNTPEQTESFGNIQNVLLSEVVKTENFQRLWYVHKKMIDVCKHCEFRHMCIDSSALIERKDGTWYRTKECNYNPYIAKWNNEDGYKTLLECGIDVNVSNFSIDEDKLYLVNKELWNE
jgi:SPASM domain peptide maturase of grasp-with-spasm system